MSSATARVMADTMRFLAAWEFDADVLHTVGQQGLALWQLRLWTSFGFLLIGNLDLL